MTRAGLAQVPENGSRPGALHPYSRNRSGTPEKLRVSADVIRARQIA